ncbi:hypothetical protein NRS6141_01679 [Bacillus subtilis]|nr:hypothetical protein NRS6141_01679 [Bacillus subtilis]CAF1891454.1 hypothetical protein NRS6204_01526 [Bacillus subtilis]CAF1892494.1 hypothetical protein NRS6205_01449 [Bacillus subtilis]
MSQGIYDKRWEQKFILPEQRAALLNRKREKLRKSKNPFSMNTCWRKWHALFAKPWNLTRFWSSLYTEMAL